MIGITVGDITGVGPEVTLKAVASLVPQTRMCFALIGPLSFLQSLDQKLGTKLDLVAAATCSPIDRVVVVDPIGSAMPEHLPPGIPAVADAAMAFLHEGARRCLDGTLAALVTGPVNKEAILRAGHSGFTGQTELLSGLCGQTDTAMMLLGCDDRNRWLRVALVTTHVPLRAVPDALTKGNILKTIRRASEACRLLKLPRARIGVCGLNPHAGEGGHIGDEEVRIIRPAVELALSEGLEVVGPMSADTLFHEAFVGGYDAVVAMYHDQGLGPLKLIGFETGVNWTLGLKFIRTSPDHGTAYDIAGKGVANPSSMVHAIRLALKLAEA